MRNKFIGSTAIALSVGLIGAAYAATVPNSTKPGTTSANTSTTTAPATPEGESMRTDTSVTTGTNPSVTTDTTMGSSGMMTKMDLDGDGMLSKKEAAKNKELSKSWNKYDANRDGKLDSMEFSQFETLPDDKAKR